MAANKMFYDSLPHTKDNELVVWVTDGPIPEMAGIHLDEGHWPNNELEVVLYRDIAETLFPNTTCVGQSLLILLREPTQVEIVGTVSFQTGSVLPLNKVLLPEVIAHIDLLGKDTPEEWTGSVLVRTNAPSTIPFAVKAIERALFSSDANLKRTTLSIWRSHDNLIAGERAKVTYSCILVLVFLLTVSYLWLTIRALVNSGRSRRELAQTMVRHLVKGAATGAAVYVLFLTVNNLIISLSLILLGVMLLTAFVIVRLTPTDSELEQVHD